MMIAEAGVHHRNSLTLACEYVLQASIAGAHAIKFQTYQARRLAARWATTYWDSGDERTQYDIFAERSLLTRGDYEELFELADELGILLLSTPFDPESATMLHELGMVAFKIASADITNYPLLRTVAAFGKPILLSTGASTFEEIRATVDMLQEFNIPLTLLHCSLSYPTALADANLGRITRLREAFPNLVIGYSDHTQPQDSELACPLAIGLGARVIEKHYTLNKALPEDDHYHAVDSAGLSRLVRNCYLAFEMTLGNEEITEAEQPARTYARRSLVAARVISAGHVLTEDDVDCKRPGTGLSPTRIDEVLGKRAQRDFEEDELIDLEGLG
jgi:N-acetylneuraminate synthase